MSRSGANSLIVCLQDPQGGDGSSDSLAIAISSNDVSPCATAAATATRSAHSASPYAAFSTLQPVTISPLEASTAAPTRKREYGAYAFSIAAKAASLNLPPSILSSVTAPSARKGTTGQLRDMRHQASARQLRPGRKRSSSLSGEISEGKARSNSLSAR